MTDATSADDAAEARDATPAPAPTRLPAGVWWRSAKRAFGTLGRENLTLIAAGCAFYALLAMAPAFAALAAIYGFFADPAVIADHLDVLRDLAPGAAYSVVEEQAQALENAGRSSLGWASVAALLLAVWTARLGVGALMTGVTIAYRERASRSFIADTAVTYLLTLLMILIAAIALGAIVVIPAALAFLPFGGLVETSASLLRWPLGLAAVVVGLGALYRYGPPRRNARVSWISPGAAVAVVLWLVVSIAFSLYVSRFGSYNETYGALGAVAALLVWFWLSALAALTGATLNAELELEMRRDTTVGSGRPLGRRGAWVADNVVDEKAGEAVRRD